MMIKMMMVVVAVVIDWLNNSEIDPFDWLIGQSKKTLLPSATCGEDMSVSLILDEIGSKLIYLPIDWFIGCLIDWMKK